MEAFNAIGIRAIVVAVVVWLGVLIAPYSSFRGVVTQLLGACSDVLIYLSVAWCLDYEFF